MYCENNLCPGPFRRGHLNATHWQWASHHSHLIWVQATHLFRGADDQKEASKAPCVYCGGQQYVLKCLLIKPIASERTNQNTKSKDCAVRSFLSRLTCASARVRVDNMQNCVAIDLARWRARSSPWPWQRMTFLKIIATHPLCIRQQPRVQRRKPPLPFARFGHPLAMASGTSAAKEIPWRSPCATAGCFCRWLTRTRPERIK